MPEAIFNRVDVTVICEMEISRPSEMLSKSNPLSMSLGTASQELTICQNCPSFFLSNRLEFEDSKVYREWIRIRVAFGDAIALP